ncbi:hypothetical protein GCM10010149_77170 [Nonomuraea roseoviolacea subsp. roseoviolacea]|uniref:TIR domain-containing protein n=1 Tax=Nonomuraea roseoviolacea TaxID=103837 RepID=UPI0031E226EB
MSEAAVYDAFISYSHTADARLAPLLEAGLRAKGKPWYRRRALRVFRDQASLPAAPELWPSIERALAASRHLVLPASPEAAASRWVRRELRWWRDNRAARPRRHRPHCRAVAGVRPRCPRPALANDRRPLPRPHRPMTTAPAR